MSHRAIACQYTSRFCIPSERFTSVCARKRLWRNLSAIAAFACEYCGEPLTTKRGYFVSRPGFERSASECKSKCRPTCCRRRVQCQLCCEPSRLSHWRCCRQPVNQQRCPTFRSARFLQIRIASGVTSECVAGVVGFVRSVRLENFTWFLHVSKNYQALAVVPCTMPQV
jgi:hypothetical protein